MSILDTHVSWFRDYYDTVPRGTVSILRWLQSEKLQQKVDVIRAMEAKADRDAAKSKLPCITPSGIFSARNTAGLLTHSGFICIDIDHTGNESIENYRDLKRELCNLTNVAYCGTSVSGTGFFLLIPLAYPERHKDQFYALKQLFGQWGIVIDNKCGNVDRLRGASFDPEAYFNHNALPFTGLPKPPVRQANRYGRQSQPPMIDGTVFERAVYYTEVIHRNKLEQGGRHWYINRLAEYLAANGVDEQTASEWIYNNVWPKDKINSNCISYPYQLQKKGTIQQPAAPIERLPATPIEPLPAVSDGPVIGPKGYPASWDDNFAQQWFLKEARKQIRISQMLNPASHYPEIVARLTPQLRRVNIDPQAFLDALNL